jgi:hypothetical protein
MAAINTTTESWSNHTHSEVEAHIKAKYLKKDNISDIVTLTKNEYNALETKDGTTLYLIVLVGEEGNYIVLGDIGQNTTGQPVLEIGSDWDVSDLDNNPPYVFLNTKGDEEDAYGCSMSISGSNLILARTIPGIGTNTVTVHTASDPLTYDVNITYF